MTTRSRRSPGLLSRHIAAILEAERRAQGLSQTALAARAGFTQSQLSKHLRGERVLTVDGLDALCTALGLDIVDVVRDADAASRSRA